MSTIDRAKFKRAKAKNKNPNTLKKNLLVTNHAVSKHAYSNKHLQSQRKQSSLEKLPVEIRVTPGASHRAHMLAAAGWQNGTHETNASPSIQPRRLNLDVGRENRATVSNPTTPESQYQSPTNHHHEHHRKTINKADAALGSTTSPGSRPSTLFPKQMDPQYRWSTQAKHNSSARKKIALPPPTKKSQDNMKYFLSGRRQRENFGLGMFRNETSSEGFKNLGNTCYINAGVQALIGIVPFLSDIKTRCSANTNNQQRDDMPLLRSLFEISENRKRSKEAKTAMNASNVKEAVAREFKWFATAAQQDVHEFIGCCLDMLDTETKHDPTTTTINNNNDTNNNNNDNTNKTRAEEDTSKGAQLSLTSANFGCEIEHTRHCLNPTCEAQTKPFHELFRNFSLDLPETPFQSQWGSPNNNNNNNNTPRLQDLLQNFFKSDHVEYRCETCGHNASKIEHSMAQLPRAIGLHLKRFHTSNGAKITRAVNIQSELNFGFCCTNTTKLPPRISKSTTIVIDDDDDDDDGDDETRRKLNFAHEHEHEHEREHAREKENDRDGYRESKKQKTNPTHVEPNWKRQDVHDVNREARYPSEEEQFAWAIAESTNAATKTTFLSPQDNDAKPTGLATTSTSSIVEETPWRPTKSGQHTYRLVSMIRHTGKTADQGHYICDVWNPTTNKWKSFNDSYVVETDEASVLQGERARQAYLLFYVHSSFLTSM